MRAAVLVGPGRIEMGDVEHPVVADGEALVEVRTLGVCGTDRKIYSGAIPVSYPRIMGHEIVGKVLDGIEGFEAGARVIVDPSIACGRCDRCLEGRGNICADGWLLGRDRDGGLREAISAPAANLHRLPDGVADDVGPLIQVLTTCVHGQRMVEVFPGESVVIVGLGVTGLLHLQLAKLRGAWPVVCLTRSEWKLELAHDLGADVTVRSGEGALDQIHEATRGGADVTIECAGKVATLAQAVEIARPGGRILAYGTIAETEGAFPFYDLYYKELAITNARAARPEDFPVAIGSVASGRVRLDPLVTHRFPLTDAAAAFRTDEIPEALKVVVDVWGGR
ncbi:MAG: alcohol dehydrogenase catalytic domain-containing protein [Actinomycetota bacterium]